MANGVPQPFAECKASPRPKCWPLRNIRAAGASHIQGTLNEYTSHGHSQEVWIDKVNNNMKLNICDHKAIAKGKPSQVPAIQ